MMEFLQAFLLGNAAILGNVCLLPLYPGMLAFLSSHQTDPRSHSVGLGVMVLTGILSMMILVGGLVYGLGQSFGPILIWLLPAIYAFVIILGILLLLDRNPFVRLHMIPAPWVRNPKVAAYLYGLLLGPMTLPCTGPIITSAFLLSIDSSGSLSVSQLLQELLFFICFGLGFGWPLVLLPLFTRAMQQRFLKLVTRYHHWLNRLSGGLLIGIGVLGFITEILPQV